MFMSRSRFVLEKLLISASKKHGRLKSTLADFQEIRIPVPWGHIAGKWWGPIDKRPILTLHGWQDNCGSFNRLIPLLTRDVSFLAIDFPGHGLSSRIPSGLYYHFTNYIILVRHLVNYFQWPKVSLMGHSLGGIISFSYSMIYPKDVDILICIDFGKPLTVVNNFESMARNIDEFTRYVQLEQNPKEPPSYTLDEIKEKICVGTSESVAYEHCYNLIERNIAPSKLSLGKYYFTRDPRLKVFPFLMNWPQEDAMALAEHMVGPVLLARAVSGSYEVKEDFYKVVDVLEKSSVDCQYHKCEGTHHFHLNNPEVLANLVNKFIERHNIEDRRVGGIKEGISVDLS